MMISCLSYRLSCREISAATFKWSQPCSTGCCRGVGQEDTVLCKSLSPGLKLAITLHFHSLAFSFRVAHNTISLLVCEVCDTIITEYGDPLSHPTSEDGWHEIAENFGTSTTLLWPLVATTEPLSPKDSRSVYYNYKGFFPFIILAVVDVTTSLCGWMLR